MKCSVLIITFTLFHYCFPSEAQWFNIATKVNSFDFFSKDVGFCSNYFEWTGSEGSYAYLRKTSDGGLNWSNVRSYGPGYIFIDVINSRWEDTCFHHETNNCSWYMSSDAGISWEYFALSYCTVWDFSFYRSNAALITTTLQDTNYIARLEQFKFDLLIGSDTIRFYQISLNDNGNGFVTCKYGDQHSILEINPPYTEWSILYTSRIPLNDIQFTSDSTGYAVGDSGFILKTDNRGEDWIPTNSGVKVNLNCMDYINADTVYCAGDSGVILSTFDGGITWNREIFRVGEKIIGIRAFSNSTLFIHSKEIAMPHERRLYTNKAPSIVEKIDSVSTEIKIHPNPFKDCIQITNLFDEYYSTFVSSIDGKVILSQTGFNVNSIELLTANWGDGVYIITIVTDSRTKQLKMVKY